MIDGGLAAFDAVHASTDRFLTSLRALDDDAVGGATLIPPWTRGHVITHVARAADSYCRLLAGAAGGRPDTPQYPSDESRAREIDDGSARPVAALVDDVVAASTAFADAMRALPDHAWSAHVRMRQGELREPADLPRIRLRELEVHHVDLDVGYEFGDVPPAVAAWVVDDVLGALARRSPLPALAVEATDADLVRELTPGAPRVRGATADLVAWLTGRSAGAGLVVDGPGEVPAAPIWI